MATLKDLREESSLTLAELATTIGVSIQTVWRWENAKARPSPSHRRKLAEMYRKETKEIVEAVKNTFDSHWAVAA